MRESKFTLNAFLLVVLIFSALTFFVTVKLTGMADRTPVNTFTPIEGTELSVRYSSLEPNGLYRGSENVNTLVLEGNFGTDWGAAAVGSRLYLNEYRSTDLGVLLSNVVCVDMESLHKEILLRNAILRGRCASGELVCQCGAMLPANCPQDNALCRLYTLTAPSLSADGSATVVYLDPESGQVLLELQDETTQEEDFAAQYLERTLEEVRP